MLIESPVKFDKLLVKSRGLTKRNNMVQLRVISLQNSLVADDVLKVYVLCLRAHQFCKIASISVRFDQMLV